MRGGEDWTDVVVASHRGVRAFNEYVRPVLEDAGFSHLGMGNVLFLLTVGESGTRVTDLVKVHGFLGSNVSYGLRALAEAGLAERGEDVGDRRVRSVRLTPRGLALLRALKAAATDDQGRVAEALRSARALAMRFSATAEAPTA